MNKYKELARVYQTHIVAVVSLISIMTVSLIAFNKITKCGKENVLLRAIASDQALIIENKRINFTSVHELELARQKYNKLLGDMYE